MALHLILSPHLDDAVLSCGGLINKLVNAGENVAALTIFAADVPADLPYSELNEQIHQRWELGDNPSPGRREEDYQALKTLGDVGVYYEDWLDCIYRVNSQGQLIYTSVEQFLNQLRPDDPLLNTPLDLSRWPELTHVYVPLGAGNHVDHQLTRKLALEWRKSAPNVAFFLYEEYPYGSEAGEVFFAYDGNTRPPTGATAVQVARSTLPAPTTPQVQSLAEANIQAKVKAIACYRSQISSFWSSLDEMAESVWNYARTVGQSAGLEYGERLWLLDQPGGNNQ